MVYKIAITFFLFTTVLGLTKVNSQTAGVPDGIIFQSIATDPSGIPAAGKTIYLQASIIQHSITGQAIYVEKFMVVASQEGVFTIVIGKGQTMKGPSSLLGIDWADGPFFMNIKVAIAPSLQQNNWNPEQHYVDMGTSQLWTVPFALNAARVTGFDLKMNSADTAMMLNPYLRKTDTANIQKRLNLKMNIADSNTSYVTPAQLAAKVFDTADLSKKLSAKLSLQDTGLLLANYVRKGTFSSGTAVINYADLINKPNLFSGNYGDLTGKPTLFSGDYSDLNNKPTIPAAQVNSDWNATTGITRILNKPVLFSGAYADLTGKPSLFSGSYTDLSNKPSLFSGDYNDLSNKPVIPAAQVNSDWNAASGITQILNKPVLFSGAYADLTGKPSLFSGSYTDLSNKPSLFSGDYNDLSNKPVIPAAQVNSDWNAATGITQILNKPVLFSGSYTDLSNKPILGTLASVNTVTLSTDVNGILSVANGGTGSSTKNFVDLTADQTVAGQKTFTGNVTVNSIIKSGGTSAQFLKADGSVDANTYLVREVADEFTATAGQTSFTLSQTKSANSKVKMYINGIRISNTAYSVSGTTLTYTAANNGSYDLLLGDRIQFDYYY